MSFAWREIVQHMIDEVNYLESASQGLSREEYLGSATLKRAFARSLEIIGEATKALPTEVIDANPQIDWHAMAGMRDRLIHAYFGIDHGIVWDVVTIRVPLLRVQLEKLSDAAS